MSTAKKMSLDPPGRGRIYDSIAETIGNTPIVRIPRFVAQTRCCADILLKLEFFNPGASVKDRIGLGMIEAMEEQGLIGPNTTLVEPTSGNTGIALAFICAAKGYRLILTMPESMSLERRKLLKFLGAEIELTRRELGMNGAISRANELIRDIGDAVMPGQFDNPANPEFHAMTTAEEIWNDTGGAVDVIVSGVGTGGTLTGCARTLKPRKPALRMIAVEPEASQVISGGAPAPHLIQGIGAGFIPGNLDTAMIDEVVPIANETALMTSRSLARQEGVMGGISSGAALAAAIEIGERPENAGKMIVVIIPSFSERYITTALFEN